MGKYISFSSYSKFYAEEHFPFGIERSGEFSVEQAMLLHNHGNAYQELHNGLRKPVTKEEKEFLKSCRGEKHPATAHEKVWLRFCEKTQKRGVISAFGSLRKPIGSNHQVDDYHY